MIGAGNVSTHISRHFHLKGHRIWGVYCRSLETASLLASRLDCPAITDPARVPEQADFYILCVPDNSIPEVLARFKGRHGTWLHTAGAVGMDVFEGLQQSYGVLYPLQTFSKTQSINLDSTPILVEGSSEEVKKTILRLGESLSSEVHEVDSASRRILHLAAVFANNFTNHMVHIAQEILDEKQLERKLLDPILQETVRKILTLGARDAQTGPALRNDMATMEKHRDLLKAHPEWEKLYTFISRDIGRTRDK